MPGKEDRLWKAVAPVATGVPRPQDFSISIVYRWALYPKSVSRLCGCHPQSCYFLCLSLSCIFLHYSGGARRSCPRVQLPVLAAEPGSKCRRTRSTREQGVPRVAVPFLPARLQEFLLPNPTVLKTYSAGPKERSSEFLPLCVREAVGLGSLVVKANREPFGPRSRGDFPAA